MAILIFKNGLLIWAENTKDFRKLIKGKNFRYVFYFFLFFNNFLARIRLTGVITVLPHNLERRNLEFPQPRDPQPRGSVT